MAKQAAKRKQADRHERQRRQRQTDARRRTERQIRLDAILETYSTCYTTGGASDTLCQTDTMIAVAEQMGIPKLLIVLEQYRCNNPADVTMADIRELMADAEALAVAEDRAKGVPPWELMRSKAI